MGWQRCSGITFNEIIGLDALVAGHKLENGEIWCLPKMTYVSFSVKSSTT